MTDMDKTKAKDLRIFEAANEVFSHKGYKDATLDEIIKIADTGKGTVYKYYKNKENLFYILVKNKNEAFLEELQKVVNKPEDFPGKLNAYIYTLTEFIKHNTVLWQVVLFEFLGGNKGWSLVPQGDIFEYSVHVRWGNKPSAEEVAIVAKYYELIMSEVNVLHKILTLGVESGLLKPANTKEAALLWSSHLFGGIAMTVFHNYGELMDSQILANTIVDRFMYGHKK